MKHKKQYHETIYYDNLFFNLEIKHQKVLIDRRKMNVNHFSWAKFLLSLHIVRICWQLVFNTLSVDILFYVGCWGLTSLLNICGNFVTVPAWSSGTLTNMLSHINAMTQTQDMTPHSVTVYWQDWPAIVLSIYVEDHTGIHNYPF